MLSCFSISILKLKLQYFGHLMRRVDSLKDSDAGRDWGQERKGMTEDEMAGWHHRLDGCKFAWTPGDGDGQQAWCAAIHGVAKSRTRLSDRTELNWTELLGRKVTTNLDSILKSRDITLPTKARIVKSMVFPVVMYGCESWTIKKVEHQRIDAFELRCWRRHLRVPWTARRSNQSILNIHWKDWCWSWSSSTLATWCEELTH